MKENVSGFFLNTVHMYVTTRPPSPPSQWRNFIFLFRFEAFLARANIMLMRYAIARQSVRLSVRPSVRHMSGSLKNG